MSIFFYYTKYIFFLFAFIFSTNKLLAQDFRWAKHSIHSIMTSVDKRGNIYSVFPIRDFYGYPDDRYKWLFGKDSMAFDLITNSLPQSTANTDMVLLSTDCNGYYRWHKVIGGNYQDSPWGLDLDTLGGVYLTGRFYHSSNSTYEVFIDNDTSFNAGKHSVFILKYDTAGVFQWIKMPTNNKPSMGQFNLTVTPTGESHLLSFMYPDTFANGAYITTQFPVGNNIHVIKYNKDGLFIGGVHLDITHSDSTGTFLRTNSTFTYSPRNDRYYFTTRKTKLLDVYDLKIGNTVIDPPVDVFNYCLASFKPDGSLEWLRVEDSVQFVGTPTFDDTGNVYISTGAFYGTTWQGNYFFNPLASAIFNEPGLRFISKFNSAGQFVSYTEPVQMTGNFQTMMKDVVYSNGTLTAIGYYAKNDTTGPNVKIGNYKAYGQSAVANWSWSNADCFIARFDAESGAIIDFDTIKNHRNSNEEMTKIITDHRNNFYLTGFFNLEIYINGDTLVRRRPPSGTEPVPPDGLLLKWGHDDCNCVAPKPDFTYSYQGAATVQYDYTGSIPYTNIEWSMGVLSPPQYGNSVSYTYSNSELQETLKICCTVTSGECGSNKICKDIDMKTLSLNGMEDIGNNLTLYPNPARATISISHNLQSAYIEVYNSTGQAVIGRRAISTNHTIDISGLSSGVYILKLINADGKHTTRKFIVN